MDDEVFEIFENILTEFGLETLGDLQRLKEERLCELYETIKASLIEEYGLDDDEIEELFEEYLQ